MLHMCEKRLRLCIGLWLGTLCQLASGEAPTGGLQLNRQVIAHGTAERDWMQVRTGTIPGKPGAALTTMNQTRPDITHGFQDVFLSLTRDGGQTWTAPKEIPSLKRTTHADHSERVPADLWPLAHPKTNKVLIVGKLFCFEGGTKENHSREQVAYAVYDPASGKVGPLRTLEMPTADHEGHPFIAANAGCNQPLYLESGDILLPVRYQKDPKKRNYTSIVARCAFDGESLTYLEHGSEHNIPTGRGLYEPSVGAFDGKYFLTLRADDGAYVAISQDGVNFDNHRHWTFDDGERLESINTQQHWLTVGGKLYLVYTRRGAGNDDVYRYRAPLLIGQVDPDRLCVLRSTEQTVLPNDGGQYGNSGICQISDDEAWITCADDGGKRKKQPNLANEVHLIRVRSK